MLSLSILLWGFHASGWCRHVVRIIDIAYGSPRLLWLVGIDHHDIIFKRIQLRCDLFEDFVFDSLSSLVSSNTGLIDWTFFPKQGTMITSVHLDRVDNERGNLSRAFRKVCSLHGLADDCLPFGAHCGSSLVDCIFPISQSTVIKLDCFGRADHEGRNFDTICGW